jgi:hypothetical protein
MTKEYMSLGRSKDLVKRKCPTCKAEFSVQLKAVLRG